MRLHSIDELPFHQTPTPFNVVATSDPNFNDGYWFSWCAPRWFFIAGMRLHPDTNTVDGFLSVAHDGEHLRGEELHGIVCSPSRRARETAMPLAEALGLEPIVDAS